MATFHFAVGTSKTLETLGEKGATKNGTGFVGREKNGGKKHNPI